MGGSGWFGAYCPECANNGGRLIEPFIRGKIEKVNCLKCGWIGDYNDLLNSKEEYVNNKRTKLIDKFLDAKEKNR